MKLSACWIVKDEAENIAKSILSVRDCAQEMLVVDTGSTDGTAEIARDCGARVESFEWRGDFSAARNYALSRLAGEYSIFIDADEYFSPPLAKVDRSVILSAFETTHAHALLVPLAGLDAAGRLMSPAPFGRIFRRDAIRYENRVHEMAKLADGSIPSGTVLNHYLLVHTGYEPGRANKKVLRNIALLEAEQAELTDEFALFNNKAYLVREYMALGDYDKAYENCRFLLEHHGQWARMSKTFLFQDVSRIYAAIGLAAAQPYRFDRDEVYEKLFRALKENYPGTREAGFADLYYKSIFDYQPNLFFAELEATEASTANLPPSAVLESRDAEAAIFELGALTAQRLGNAAAARRWGEICKTLRCP